MALYGYTPDTTGETLPMVYEIGAQLIDLEMVLYYPGVVVYPPRHADGWYSMNII
jgi:succinate dehydrogenase/fumarate reductase flavoprotein subunit